MNHSTTAAPSTTATDTTTTPAGTILEQCGRTLARHLVTATLIAFLLSAAASFARQEESGQQGDAGQPFAEVIDVEVINIDVYVTDRDGNPVRGLEASDFQLEIDGKPVPISNFYAVESDDSDNRTTARAVAEPDEDSADASEGDGAETDAQAGDSQDGPPPEQRLHVVVYIDNYNLTPFKRNRVLNELRQFLRGYLGPDDQVMLASYDRSLHLREPFTSRPEHVSRALLDMEDISAAGIHASRERVDVLRRIEDADTVTEALGYATDWAASQRNDLSFTIDSLRSIVENLAGSPGRKAVIYVSEGLPMIPGEDMFYVVQQKFQEQTSMNYAMEYDMSRRFSELADQANANRVSFYTIDASGLTVLSQGTVDYDIKGAPGERTFFDSVHRSNLQSTVQLLAERTGGRAIINTNRYLPDLVRIANDFQNYYSLGYVNPDSGDGRRHKIDVRTPNLPRGYNVRSRDSFRSKTVETQMHEGTLSALNLDLQDNPLDARLLFGRPQQRSDGFYDVPLAIQVPFEKLVLLPQGDEHRGSLRMWFAAKDEKDEISDIQELPVNLSIPADKMEEIANENWTYRLDLTMESGYHDVAIGLYDTLGTLKSFVRRGVPVGEVGRRTGGR